VADNREGTIRIMVVMLLCVLMTGCSSLILREDDTAAETAGKVATRSLLVLPTLFQSERFIKKARLEEERAAVVAEQAVYFSAQCVNEGFAAGSAEHRGCLSVKQTQTEPVQVNNSNKVILMPQQRTSTTCYSSGRWTNCY
jgi:hypothetical protein